MLNTNSILWRILILICLMQWTVITDHPPGSPSSQTLSSIKRGNQVNASTLTLTGDNAKNVDLVSHFGDTTTKAVFVQGHYAYVGVDSIQPELAILDVANPMKPTQVGRVLLAEPPLGITVQAGNAYLAMGAAGIAVVDVSDVTRPVVIGSHATPGSAQSVSVSGSHAYVPAREAGLRILDISIPAVPTEVGFYDSPGTASDITLMGDTAYLADGAAGMRILNISNPMSPSEIGAYSTTDLDPSGQPAFAAHLSVAGNYAYVAYGSASLRVVDVSDPTAPVGVYTYPAGSGDVIEDVVVSENHAYLLNQEYFSMLPAGIPFLIILNLSTPTSPTKDSETDELGGDSLMVVGNNIYIAVAQEGLTIGDVTNPVAPIRLSSWDNAAMYAQAVVATSGYAYVVGGGCWGTWFCEGSFHVIDIANPNVPVDVSSSGEVAHDIDIAGKYAYLPYNISRVGAVLGVLDISNPATPTMVGNWSTDDPNHWWTPSFSYVTVSGHYAYVSDQGGGVYRFDVADPTHPVQDRIYPGLNKVAVLGHYIYSASGEAGLYIYDAARNDSNWDVPVGHIDTLNATYVAVRGNYAYVADGDAGLRVIDISNPANPSEAGYYDTPGTAVAVKVDGASAYVADGSAGLRVIDISNPATPFEVGFYDTPGTAAGLAVIGNYVYVADTKGLLVLQPLRDKATVQVAPGGGDLLSTDGNTSLHFSMGNFTQTVNLTYRRWMSDLDVGELTGIGHTFEVTAVNSDNNQPVQWDSGQSYSLSLHYAESELGPAIETTLAFYYWDDTKWVREPTSSLDALNNTLMATPNRLSLWAVLGETKRIFLPSIRVSVAE